MKRRIMTIVALVLAITATAQTVTLNSEKREESYVKTILERSEKAISDLKLSADKAEAVRNIIANRYFELNDIYAERDEFMASLDSTIKGRDRVALTRGINQECDSKLYRSHFAFAAQLGMFLTEDQIVAVKDAITYNKVKVTYDAYLDEIPSLKAEEKTQILAWLLEARELALDAEGSKQKHEVFNKYKGRINNFLSKQDYDLNKEREEWFKRLEERKAKEGDKPAKDENKKEKKKKK